MDDGDIRELAHRFFDAIERRDVAMVAALYAPDLKFWFNVTRKESTREENLASLTEGYGRHRRRTYNDRIIHTFDGGFMMQYTLNIVHHSGETMTLWACLVALCRDGKITRIDEYLDSGKFSQAAPLNRQAAAASGGF
jgi:ketosteroid isomerase-like protein